MRIALVDNPNELAELRPEWEALPLGSPMLSPTWLEAWWNVFGAAEPGSRLFVLAVRDAAGRLLGLAPWHIAVSRLQQRVIRFLGSGVVCSDHMTIPAQPELGAAIVPPLLEFLFQPEIRRAWDEFDLDGVDYADLTMARFAAGLAARHEVFLMRKAAPNTWRLTLPASWDEYLESLSKNRRKRLRRWERGYFESGRAVCHFAEAENLAEFTETLIGLHNLRRRALGQPGAFEQEQFAAFHRAVMPQLFAEGRLVVSRLDLDSLPVAAEYLLRDEHTWYAYQSGIDPRAMEDGPGGLSLMALLRRAMEEGCRTFDFLRGDEEYKSHWGTTSHAAVRLRVRGRTLRGGMLHLADQLRTLTQSEVG